MLPAPVLSKFARTVYGHRFFRSDHVLSGPVGTYRLAGAPITEVYPIVPLAPHVPLGVGSLSWDGTMFLGVSIVALVDADRFTAAFRASLADLFSAGVPLDRRVDE